MNLTKNLGWVLALFVVLLTTSTGNAYNHNSCRNSKRNHPHSHTCRHHPNAPHCDDDDTDHESDLCSEDPLGDSDGDGVCDSTDICLDTAIPEAFVPRWGWLLPFRFALINDDTIFDAWPFHHHWRPGNGHREIEFTLEDTGGCSCEQILMRTGAGRNELGADSLYRQLVR